MEHKLELQIFKETASDFDDFLNSEFTDKIVFSGKYGAGKTTFLNCFFSDQKALGIQNRDYDLFRISPVHYSVASNEDIIELIKYDIISQFLVKPHIEIIENDVPLWYLFSNKDVPVIMENVLSLLSIKGVDLQPVIEKIKVLGKYFREKRKKLSESGQFSEFLDGVEEKLGVFERDVITRLIENVLFRLKVAGRKPILLIDDFDRLDPEHIFRVLNVFSAHVDEELFSKRGQKNKFGFSKVIIVCDQNNIRSLFHTRYGSDADFAGYFDKFYNKVIFRFDVRKEVRSFLRRLLHEMHDDVAGAYRNELHQFDRNQDELFQQTIIYGILSGHFTLRGLLRIKKFNVQQHYRRLHYSIAIRSRGNDFTLLQMFLNLFLFNGSDGLLNIFNEMYAKGVEIKIDPYAHSLIASIEVHFKPDTKEAVTIHTDKARFNYKLQNGEWEYSGTNLLPGVTMNTSQDQIIDLLRYFAKRIKLVEERS